MLPDAMASSMDLTGAAELLAPLRDVRSAAYTDGDDGFVGEDRDASGLVAPRLRGRMLMPGTWSSLPISEAPGVNLVGLGERRDASGKALLSVVSGVLYCWCVSAAPVLEGVATGLRIGLDRLLTGERGDLGDVGLSETAFEKPPLPVPRCSL